jgi:hypothetical protein
MRVCLCVCIRVFVRVHFTTPALEIVAHPVLVAAREVQGCQEQQLHRHTP